MSRLALLLLALRHAAQAMLAEKAEKKAAPRCLHLKPKALHVCEKLLRCRWPAVCRLQQTAC